MKRNQPFSLMDEVWQFEGRIIRCSRMCILRGDGKRYYLLISSHEDKNDRAKSMCKWCDATDATPFNCGWGNSALQHKGLTFRWENQFSHPHRTLHCGRKWGGLCWCKIFPLCKKMFYLFKIVEKATIFSIANPVQSLCCTSWGSTNFVHKRAIHFRYFFSRFSDYCFRRFLRFVRKYTEVSTKDVTRHSSLMALVVMGGSRAGQEAELDDPNFSAPRRIPNGCPFYVIREFFGFLYSVCQGRWAALDTYYFAAVRSV